MYGYIYMTENLVNGKKYIGQHKSGTFDKSYFGSGKMICQALKKYGSSNFSVKILETCNSFKELNEREFYWIRYYNAVNSEKFYNLVDGGNQNNAMLGKHHTPEAIEKCRRANLGRKYSAERCEKMSKAFSGEGNPRYGCTLSEEIKEKQRNSIKKTHKEHPEILKQHSEFMKNLFKDKNNHPMYGKHHTDEAKKKISEKAKGRKLSEEAKQKMSVSHKKWFEENPKERKPIMCVETGMLFNSAEEVCNYLGLSRKSEQCFARSARKHAKGINSTAFGLHWMYPSDET